MSSALTKSTNTQPHQPDIRSELTIYHDDLLRVTFTSEKSRSYWASKQRNRLIDRLLMTFLASEILREGVFYELLRHISGLFTRIKLQNLDRRLTSDRMPI